MVKEKKRKESFIENYARSPQSLSFPKKSCLSLARLRERIRVNGEGSVSEWKRDLSSSDCHGQGVMGNRIRFLEHAFDRVVVHARR